jgi:hypothetical protein
MHLYMLYMLLNTLNCIGMALYIFTCFAPICLSKFLTIYEQHKCKVSNTAFIQCTFIGKTNISRPKPPHT